MKKTLTLIAFGALLLKADAQVGCIILEPPSIAGAYTHTYATQALTWDNMPDMTDPANAVQDTLALAYDGTAADSLCCEAIANPADINGKIAVIYRGTCNFSIKAYNAQQAGAVGVIIISNSAAALINPSGGTNQELVTIPVFLIEMAAGANIRAELDLGSIVVGYLGSTVGLFANDVGMSAHDMLMPPSAAVPAILAQNASEFSAQLGAWVHNIGNQDQTGVSLTVDVSLLGSSIYNQTSTTADIVVGDSAFFQVSDFSQSTYGGYYTITYTANLASGDEFDINNEFTTTLHIDDMFSYAQLGEDGIPLSGLAVKPNPGNGEYNYCAHFRDANASRVAVTGIQSYIATNATSATPTLDGQLVTLRAFEWLDEFTGLSDANLLFDVVNELQYTDHIITVDTTAWRSFLPFTNPIPLQDNVRYLFCLSVTNTDLFLGGDDDLDYITNESVYDQPTTPLFNGTSGWSIGFVATQSSNAIQMIDVNDIGIAEQEQSLAPAYPNPAKHEVRIPLRAFHGAAQVRVIDAAGKLISTQRGAVQGGQLVVSTEGIAPGAYTFEVRPDDGVPMSFTVVVAR